MLNQRQPLIVLENITSLHQDPKMNESTNRGRMVMSRRQQPQQQQMQQSQTTSTGKLPLHLQQQQMGSHQRPGKRKTSDTPYLQPNTITAGGANVSGTRSLSPLPLPPRSGQLSITTSLMENIEEFMNYGAPKKKKPTQRKFHVDIPRRLLVILAAIFLIAPILIFLHKEAHIHDHHDEAHFKSEKFVNVDTEAVLSQFRVNITKDDSSHDQNVPKSSGDDFQEIHGGEKPLFQDDVEQVDVHMDPPISKEKDGIKREDKTVTEAIEKIEVVQNVNQTLLSSTASEKDPVWSNSTDLKFTDRKQ
jgi:hypothetical protein